MEDVDKSSLNLTDDDKFLRMKAKQIYDKYILNDQLASITTEKYRLELVGKCNDIQKVAILCVYSKCLIIILFLQNFHLEGKWFIYALQTLTSMFEVEEIENLLCQGQTMNLSSSLISRPTIQSIKCTVDSQFSNIETARQEMIENFQTLPQKIMGQDKVDQYINCHVKKISKTKCILCVAESKFMDYEKCLYNVQYRTIFEEVDDKNDTNVRNRYFWIIFYVFVFVVGAIRRKLERKQLHSGIATIG